ncbi:MAG: tetratricopeptide repeat protein [Elusimicrobia bacterium]|nr:tetratricopeptide repeat protein [Elusimicrobiota bacterium]
MNRRLACALVFAATALAFLPGLRNGFVSWDDRVLLVQNPYFRGLGWPQIRWAFAHFQTGKYMPLAWLSFELDYALWGMNPAGYHLSSLLLHAAAAALFFLVALRLTSSREAPRRGAPVGAVFAALFFSLHPLRVESVSWATERADPLAAVFYLAAVLLYLRRRLGLSCAAFALSLLAKATGITLPAVLLLLDVYPLRRWRWGEPGWQKLVAEKVPFAAVSLIFACAGLAGQATTRALVPLARFGAAERLAQACYGPVFYLAKTLWPSNLSPLYVLSPRLTPAPFVLSGLFMVLLSGLLIARRRETPWALAAWCFYLVALLPVIGLVKLGLAIASDRYTYLASFGPALLAGLGAQMLADKGPRPRWLWSAALAAGLCGLTAATVAQIGTWRDSVVFWRHAVAVDPDCYVCHKNLGDALAAQGLEEESREHLVAGALLLAKARHDLGVWYYDAGRYAEAAQRFSEALDAAPGVPETENNLGLALQRLGRPAEAAARFEAAVRAKPDFAPALVNWGAALAALGRREQARDRFRRALALEPGNLQAAVGLELVESAWRAPGR